MLYSMKHPYVLVVTPFEVENETVVGETVEDPIVVGVLDVTTPEMRPTELYAIPTAVLSQQAYQRNKIEYDYLIFKTEAILFICVMTADKIIS